MNAASTNQITNILYFNDKYKYIRYQIMLRAKQSNTKLYLVVQIAGSISSLGVFSSFHK